MKRILLLVMFVFGFAALWAQERNISGKVTSVDDGSSIPGVNVLVKGTSNGTVTDSEGTYRLSIPSSGILVFSFVGFQTLEVPIGNQSIIDAQLQTDVTQLSEVVITGYGAQEKRQITGSISQVKGSVIENLPLQSFDRALQGRASGVLVQSNNGIPGGGVNVRIRGVGSISAGNNPLYIVDGVQINNRNDANFTQANPLAFLNPNDIASMEVLKDAASASIYGAQAANGVVIITTKKGKAGKPQLDLNYYEGVSEPLKYLDVLNAQEWFSLRREARINSGNTALAATQNTLNEMGRLPANFATLTEGQLLDIANALPTFDWQREAFQTGRVRNAELSFSGGDDKNKYYISGSFNEQQAIITPVDFVRGTLKLDVTNTISPKLRVATSINLSSFTQNLPFGVSGSFLGSPAFSSSAVLPHNPVFNEDGTFNTNIAGVLNQNVVAVSAQNSGRQVTNQAVGNMTFNYQIIKDLSFKSLFGLDYRLVQGEQYRDPRTPDGQGVQGRNSQQSIWNSNFITTQTLNYNKSFNKTHSINALAGIEYRSETVQSIDAASTGFPSFLFRDIGSGAVDENVTGFWSGFKRFSVFGQVNYDFKKKYLATVTLRQDASSRFGSNNRSALFKSLSVGWALKEENFLKDVEFVSDLKIRASIGQTGNDDIGDFGWRALTTAGAGSSYNGASGLRLSSLANPNLTWETNETVNFGIDYGFFNNRVSGSFEAFRRTTKGLLLFQPTPWLSGFDGYFANVGELQNQGIEFEINTVNFDRNGFTWKTNFNFTYVTNEVTQLYGGLRELPGNPSVRVGHSLGTHFVQQYAGVNPASGRPMWYDQAGNVVYSPIAADRTPLGNTLPEFFGGFTNTFQYKGFGLDLFFNYEYGRVVPDGQVGFLRENGTRLTLNALQATHDARWTTPGQVTWIPRPVVGGAEVRGVGVNTGNVNLWKADYIRLKQVTLSYTFPRELIQRFRLNRARIYAQGINLWTYDDYLGYDPEFVDIANNGAGILPQAKNYTIGIQLGF